MGFVAEAVAVGLWRGGEEGVGDVVLSPKEGEPLWSKYSTQAIMHTLDVYSKFTFDSHYPVAIW